MLAFPPRTDHVHVTRYRIVIYTTHTRLRPQKKEKTKRPEKFEPVIDKPAELLLCFYSRVTWWRETLWLEGRKTFTITWHIVSIPSKHNDFVAFLRCFFFSPLVISSTNNRSIRTITSRYPKNIYSELLNHRWRQNSKVLSHTSLSLPASPLSPRPLLFLFPIHLTFPLRLPSFPFIKARGGCWSLKEGATGPRRAPWHAYSRVRQT